jgi:hypothetical protein
MAVRFGEALHRWGLLHHPTRDVSNHVMQEHQNSLLDLFSHIVKTHRLTSALLRRSQDWLLQRAPEKLHDEPRPHLLP